MKQFIGIISLLCWMPLLLAQDTGAGKQANKLYKDLGYAQYAKLKGDKSIKDLDKATLEKLGISYRKTGDSKNAEKVYQQLLEAAEDNAQYRLYYAQALHANGNYSAARKQYQLADQGLKAEGDGEDYDQRAKKGFEACSQIAAFRATGKVTLKNEKKLNSPQLDFSPMYYKDGLVFVSTRNRASLNKKDIWIDGNCMDLYYAKQTDATFETPKNFSDELNTKLHEGPVVFTDDTETIYFTRNNYLNGKRGKSSDKITKLKIYKAEQEKGRWKNIEELPFNDKEQDVCHPALSVDERILVFASSSGENHQGGMDLYLTYWIGNSWSTPVNLGEQVNTAGDEIFPYIHDDGKLYFASNGRAGLGGLDIFVAHKIEEGPDALWEFPVNLGAPFNSRKDDFGFILAPDGKAGYLTSNRPGGLGADDIYSFKVEKGDLERVTPMPTYPLQLCVFDRSTSERIEGAEIYLKKVDGNVPTSELSPMASLDGATVVMTLTPVEGTDNEYRVRLSDLRNAQQGALKIDPLVTNTNGLTPATMQAGKTYQLEVYKDGYLMAKEVFKMPLSGVPADEYCIGLIQEGSALASNQPSADPNNPNYDPRLDPNHPSYDPAYVEQLNDPNNPNSPNYVGNPPRSGKGPLVTGVVKHQEYGRPIPGSEVTLLNRCTGEELVRKVGKDGRFSFPLDCECEYVIKARKKNFIGDNEILSLLEAGDCDEPKNVELVMAPGFDRMGRPLKVGQVELLESIKEGDVIELKNIYYDFDQYYIRKEASSDLDDLIVIMKLFPSMEIELSSHTDARATFSYNETLSSNRAKAAKEYLVQRGIEASRIVAKGYGESRPRNKCRDGVDCSEYEHQRNRRTEVFVTKFDKKDIQVSYRNNEPSVVDPKR